MIPSEKNIPGVIIDNGGLFDTTVDGRRIPKTALKSVPSQSLYRQLWITQHRTAVKDHIPMTLLLTDDELMLLADHCPCVEWEMVDLVGYHSTLMWSPVLLPVIWNYLRGLRR